MSEIPPLRVLAQDGTFNQIPVFEQEFSGATLTKIDAKRVRIAISGSQGPSGPAGTGMTIGTAVNLGSAGYLLMVSGGPVLGQVSSAYFVDTSRAISTIYPISGGGNLGLSRTFSVDTSFLVNTGRTLTAGLGIDGGGNLSADRTFDADTSLLVTTARTISTIYPISGGGNLSLDRSFAVDTAFLVNTGRSISTQQGLYGGGNLSADRTFGITTGSIGQMFITSAGTALGGVAWVDSGAGGGSGTVNTGSANYLTYYPSAGTTVDDVNISVTTGSGIAPFNVQILTAGAASVASGDFWFQSSSNIMYLMVRSSTTTYFVAMNS